MTALTREQVFRARGWPLDENRDPEPEPEEGPTVPDTPTCIVCSKPLEGRRTIVCGDECSRERDRRRALDNYRRRARPRTPSDATERATGPRPKPAPPTFEPSPRPLNGATELVRSLLSIPNLGELELDVDGHRLVIRPKAAA